MEKVISDPAIYVNDGIGSPVRYSFPGGTLAVPGNGTSSRLMSIHLSNTGTYTICPDPN